MHAAINRSGLLSSRSTGIHWYTGARINTCSSFDSLKNTCRSMAARLDDDLDAALIDEFDADPPASSPPAPPPPAPPSRQPLSDAHVHYPSFDDAENARGRSRSNGTGANHEAVEHVPRYPTAQLAASSACTDTEEQHTTDLCADAVAEQPSAPVSGSLTPGAHRTPSRSGFEPAASDGEQDARVNQLPPQSSDSALGNALHDADRAHPPLRLSPDPGVGNGAGMTDEELLARRRAVEREMREYQARMDYVALALAGQTPHQRQMRMQREMERVERDEARLEAREARVQHQIEQLHDREADREARAQKARKRRTASPSRTSCSPPAREGDSDEESAFAIE